MMPASPGAAPKRKRRVYQACEPCRIRKAKCDRGSDDDPRPPPCARCMRESIQSQCIITSKRPRRALEASRHQDESAPSRRFNTISSVDLSSPYSNRPNTDALPASQPQQPSHTNVGNPNSRQYVSSAQRNLTNNVIHTLVSKPNDALSLLFDAAGHEDPSLQNSRAQSPDNMNEIIVDQDHQSLNRTAGADERRSLDSFVPHSSHTSPAESLPKPSSETLRVWSGYRFVRRGWLSASEAVLYIDLFFRNLSPLSPILLGYYSNHSNHGALISEEPMLCTTIFVISSRYHVLPGDGGVLRSEDIHRKFWSYWKTLFMRVIYGQDTEVNAKTRNIGTIESFLLMTEWHARALHFPVDADGWDYEMIDEAEQQADSGSTGHGTSDQKRSTDEVEGAARRSDRMSWMLLGSALSMAHELGVSDQHLLNRDAPSQHYSNEDDRLHAEFIALRRSRPRRLLYVYINQLASRLGWTSMIPRIISDSAEQTFGTEADKQWHNVMSRWIGLTRLMKTASDMLFSSVTTKQLLRTGNYVTSLEHFGQLLEDWHVDYLNLKADKRFLDILFIEFQFVRTYINSLAVQAIVERAFKVANPSSGPTDFLMTFVFEGHSVDYGFVKEVVDGSREILKKVLDLNGEGLLRFCPIRIFSRIISASILLLKATGLGTRTEEAQVSLELIDQLIQALRYDPVDELHLANRYASLLETYVKAFRRRFLRVSRSRDNPSRSQLVEANNFPSSDYPQQRGAGATVVTHPPSVGVNLNAMITGDGPENFNGNDIALWAEGMSAGISGDDWMCLPLDALDPCIMEFNNGLGARGLEFFSMG